MPKYDTCYFDDGFGSCNLPSYLEESCSHCGEDRRCLADDEDLLTYEDFLQLRKVQSSSETHQSAPIAKKVKK